MADLADSLYGQHLEAIQAELIAAALPEIGSNIHIRKFPWVQPADTLPIALICNVQDRRQREGMIGLIDIRCRAFVAFIMAANRDLTSNLGTELAWRQEMVKRFDRTTRLRARGLTGAMSSEYEPGVPQDAEAFVRKNYDAQYFIVQTRCRIQPAAMP